MNILVTGGSGFIGSAIVYELQKEDYEVIVVDRKIQPWIQKTGCEYYEMSLEDYKPSKAIDVIFHAAAKHIVSESSQNPLKYYDQNLNGLLSVIKMNPGKIIFSSSAAVYGLGPTCKENSETKPINIYGKTKLLGEQILQDCGINHVSLRYFNVAGAGYEHGYIQNPQTHILPILMDCAKNQVPFSIFGDNHPTRDGTCVRDYIHVKDVAKINVMAMNYTGPLNCLNVGRGFGISIYDLIKRTEKLLNVKIPVKIQSSRDYDPSRLVANTRLLKNQFEWNPQHSLDDMILDAWAWKQNIIKL